MSGKKIALIVLAVILVVLLAVGGALAAYVSKLSDSLKYEGDLEALQEVLTEATYTEPFYVLVIGSDEWEDYGQRSDAMVLCRVDLNTPQVTMVSIPRDTPYEIAGETQKLNEVYAQGGEVACIQAVSELTGVSIAHYVEVHFDQLENVVDTLGGITVDVPYTIDYQVYTKDQDVVHIDAGSQRLTGEQAVALARMRTAYNVATDISDNVQDAIRQANIRAMMLGMMKEILSGSVADIPGRVETLAGMVATDIPMSDLIDWATTIAQAGKVKVYSCTGPFQGGIDQDSGLWLTVDAPEQWAALMKVVNEGGDPSNVLGDQVTSDGAVHFEGTTDLTTGEDASSEGTGGEVQSADSTGDQPLAEAA